MEFKKRVVIWWGAMGIDRAAICEMLSWRKLKLLLDPNVS